MRFRLSTFLLLLTVFALLAGWLVDRRLNSNKFKKQHCVKIEVAAAIAAANEVVDFYDFLKQSDNEFVNSDLDRYKNGTLLLVVIRLHAINQFALERSSDMAPPFMYEKREQTEIKYLAGAALSNLGVPNWNDFESKLTSFPELNDLESDDIFANDIDVEYNGFENGDSELRVFVEESLYCFRLRQQFNFFIPKGINARELIPNQQEK